MEISKNCKLYAFIARLALLSASSFCFFKVSSIFDLVHLEERLAPESYYCTANHDPQTCDRVRALSHIDFHQSWSTEK